MRIILFVLIFITSNSSYGDTITMENLVQLKVLEQQVSDMEKQNELNEQHYKELELHHENQVKEIIDEKEKSFTRWIIGYGFMFTAFFALISFLLTYYGKDKVIEFVKDEITKTAVPKIDEQLEIKMSDQLIKTKIEEISQPLIAKLLSDIKNKAEGDVNEFTEEYKSILMDLNSSIKSKNTNSTTSEEEEKLAEFVEVLEEAKDEKDYLADDWFWKAREEINKKEYKAALSSLKKSLKLKKSSKAYLWIGHVKNNLKDYLGAIEDINMAIDLDSKNSSAYSLRAVVNEALKKYDEAILDYDKAIGLDNMDRSYFNNRGYIFTKIEKYTEALKDFDKAILIDPKFPNPYKHKAMVLFLLNDLVGALENVNKALKLQPDYADAIELKNSITNKLNK